jgi:hypothetical protein
MNWEDFLNSMRSWGNKAPVFEGGKEVSPGAIGSQIGGLNLGITGNVLNKGYDTMAGWGQGALKFGDQYGKGITEGLKAISALKGMSNQKRQLKDARENADYLRNASRADIGTRFESQGAKRALQMGSSLEDAYKKGADYSNERMAQWGLK